MDMEQLYSYVPRELVTFVLVTLFSLLIGLSQLSLIHIYGGTERGYASSFLLSGTVSYT